MGIKQLSKVISDRAPTAVRENEMKNYFGTPIAHPLRPSLGSARARLGCDLCALGTSARRRRRSRRNAGRKVAIDASMSIYQVHPRPPLPSRRAHGFGAPLTCVTDSFWWRCAPREPT